MVLLGFFFQLLGNLFHADVFAQIIIIHIGLHIDQVDNAAEILFSADGQLNGNCVGLQPVLDHVKNVVEVCTHDVHFVDINHAGHVVLVRLVPYGFGLWLNAALRAHDSDRTVENTQ
ncbi:hypothetical protein SDC9_160493 [bioreactor metagenome]|uniref:Uncharacterized protein n=1 Tax=bioreactor metagenome TaxID=1076179 RepID=A0A645FLV2_9ZZZZ